MDSPPAEANKQVQQWAEEIEKQSGGATAEQKALAELALNHYANAAQLFNEAGNADRQAINAEDAQEQALAAQEKALQAQMQALQAAQQSLLDKLRTPMRELLDHSNQAAGAYRLNGQYHEATQTLESAATAIDAEYNKFPDDKGFHELWLEAVGDAADARVREGAVAPADVSLALLEQSANDYQSLAGKYAVLGDRQEEAAAHDGLGVALEEEGARVSGDKSAALLDQAVQAFRSALEVRTKADLPQDWAKTQDDLGVVLTTRECGPAETRPLACSIRRSRHIAARSRFTPKPISPRTGPARKGISGLRSKTRETMDDRRQSRRPVRSGGAGVSQRARGRHQSAISRRTGPGPKTASDMRSDDEGERAGGDKAVGLFDQAAQAYRSALEVYTQAGQPQAWAGHANRSRRCAA